MKIIYTILAIVIIELVFEGLSVLLGLNDNSSDNSNPVKQNNIEYGEIYKYSRGEYKDMKPIKHNFEIKEEFEEADSIYDKEGNEHIVDYDGYCEECDDYHW